MEISFVCTAFLGVLVFGLGLNVSLNRMRTKSAREDLKNPRSSLFRARMAHSNACQYAPMLALLILLNTNDLAGILGIVAVVSRYLHAFGFLAFTKPPPNPFVFGGALGTYLSGLGLSIMVLVEHLKV